MTIPIALSKYEAVGNDFLLMLDLADARPLRGAEVEALCDRWFGVGADGVIRLTAGPPQAPYTMDLTNADGTAAEVSGNGLRCVGAFLHDRGLVGSQVSVQTPAGVRHVSLDVRDDHVTGATVAMGPPDFARGAIPMSGPQDGTFLGQPVDVDGARFTASAVSMGNPHLVLFLDQVPDADLVAGLGPVLERHPSFPDRTNVEFALVGPEGIDVRVWERGVGETRACGTGACAVAVVAHQAGLIPARVAVRFPGGRLEVERTADDVLLSGPVRHVFEGSVDLEALLAAARARR